jgi:hypothetical protein
VTRDLDVCAVLDGGNVQSLRKCLPGPFVQCIVGDLDRVRASAIEVELFGRKVKVMGLEQLIAAKEAAGRPKDLLVATELRAIAALSASP